MSTIPKIRFSACFLALSTALTLVAGTLAPAFAQQEAPAQEAPAEEAPAKPKPKPRPKPAPKPKPAEPKAAEKAPEAEKPAEKPAEAKSDAKPDSKPNDATVLEPAAPAAPAVWPNGARSVSEAYGDWTMNCVKEGSGIDCVIIQSQGDRRTGKRQFSVELHPPKDGRAEGLILMPFGLEIEPGVSFKLDDRALGKGAPYSYCVADGCLVPISLPTLATDAMKTAQNLTVSAMKKDAKEPTVITVPLSGFAAAFSRAIAFGG